LYRSLKVKFLICKNILTDSSRYAIIDQKGTGDKMTRKNEIRLEQENIKLTAEKISARLKRTAGTRRRALIFFAATLI